MSDQVHLTINGREVSAPQGATILAAAQSIGEAIPTICYHEACTANALCRLCVVEVEGARVLVPACTAQVNEGMRVNTRSERVERSRRTILEMLASTVNLSEAPEIMAHIATHQAQTDRFPQAERRSPPLLDDNPMYVRDYEKCILCWRCVQVCAEDAQYTYAINFGGRGFETSIATFFERPMPATTCVFCGQCVGVCPSGALKPKREWLLEQGLAQEDVLAQTRQTRRGRAQRGGRDDTA
jgi:NADH dehydrogenase/NADH:ubiquinone oxidoreductase subunit G